MALLTKYRPKTWAAVKGHKEVISSIVDLLRDQKDVPQAWMFTGGSGCGKTTVARILAKELGAVGAGLVEINSADLRGIDAVRDIVGTSAYRIPGSSRSVYILDECHQLTDAAQNALLKALEDAPAHVVYILCTTDPGKVIPTIRTRCREFPLGWVSGAAIEELILDVAEAEGDIDLVESVLNTLVEYAQGSPRLALNLLERVRGKAHISEQALPVLESVVSLYSNEGDIKLARQMFRGVADGDWGAIATIFDTRRFTPDELVQVVRGLMAMTRLELLKRPNEWVANFALILETKITSEATLMGVLYRALQSNTVQQSWSKAAAELRGSDSLLPRSSAMSQRRGHPLPRDLK